MWGSRWLSASAASRYALGADGAGAARPGACGEPDRRLALGARRRGRCAPVRQAGQPEPLGCHRRLAHALGADGMGAARPGACGSLVGAARYAFGADGVGAARPGAQMCTPPITCARCLLVVGMSKTSCATRCSRRSLQDVFRAPAEGEGREGWDRHRDARACHRSLCAAAACAVRVGAARHWNASAFPPGQAYPPHCERVHCDGVRCSGAHRRCYRRRPRVA